MNDACKKWRMSGVATFRRLPLILSVVLATQGCVSEKTVLTGPEADNLVAQIAKSDVGPGPEQVDSMSADMIFSSVCADTAPSFRKAPAVMAKMPFRQHPGTGTYYHQNLDLSIKLLPKRCSMVFTSKEDPMQLGLGMAAVAASDSGSPDIGIDPNSGAAMTKGKGGTSFELTPMGRSSGRNWYRAVLIAP